MAVAFKNWFQTRRLPPASQALIAFLDPIRGSRPRLYAAVRSADSQNLMC